MSKAYLCYAGSTGIEVGLLRARGLLAVLQEVSSKKYLIHALLDLYDLLEPMKEVRA